MDSSGELVLILAPTCGSHLWIVCGLIWGAGSNPGPTGTGADHSRAPVDLICGAGSEMNTESSCDSTHLPGKQKENKLGVPVFQSPGKCYKTPVLLNFRLIKI